METRIPFDGFYETIHSEAIERRYDVEDGQEQDDAWQKRWDEHCANFREDANEYCRAYVKAFSELVGIPLTFKVMTSPKEYNFRTDEIYAEISEEDVEKLKKAVEPDRIREYVKAHFTSRDGFASFYDNDYDRWLSQEDPFDHNQICALLETVAAQKDNDWEETVYAEASENF
jgi:hypothetical protein